MYSRKRFFAADGLCAPRLLSLLLRRFVVWVVVFAADLDQRLPQAARARDALDPDTVGKERAAAGPADPRGARKDAPAGPPIPRRTSF